MAGLSDRQPNYLSSRSADVVLSEIRPTKLTPDALRSVNVLLDELLWMILSAARSFSTDQLKGGLNKILPTPLGKEALLEAEVELRAYWDRTASSSPPRPYVENAQDFPLQPAYELMRHKCEGYSTFNDTDEDSDVENRWLTKMTNLTGFSSHNTQFIAPAALYLTAIIEHVCEHILSNTGRVASRDSSRTAATLSDLYVALCEDETIYGLFKNMKVHDQIEQQSKALANRPRRSKSIQRSMSEHARASSFASPNSSGSVNNESGPTSSRPRLSSESAGSGTANVAAISSGSRTSIEKSKAKKMFGRTSADKEGSQNGHGYMDGGHRRSDSLISNGKRSVTPYDDGPGSSPSATEVEFDELMRSGGTMKVSLTPDRLKTFEVYHKEKGRRVGINGIPLPSSTLSQPMIKAPPHAQDSSADTSASDEVMENSKNGRPPQLRAVESIVEDEDGGMFAALGGDFSGARARKKSRGPPPVSYEKPAPITNSRTRSMSASQSSISSLTNRDAVGRKASLSALNPVSSQTTQSIPPANLMPKLSDTTLHNIPTGHGGRQSSTRDSIDDLLDGSSDESEIARKTPIKPKPKAISTTTADLISFLNDGPPDLPRSPSQPVNLPPIDHRAKQGRFRSMVARLTRGGSSERLPNQSSADDLQSPKRLNPPPSFPPTLSAKKSLRNISTFSQLQNLPSVTLPKPPPPPPVAVAPVPPPMSVPLSPPSSPSMAVGDSYAVSPARSRTSPTAARKAVPSFTVPARDSQTGRHVASAAEPKQAEELPTPTSKRRTEQNRTQPSAGSPIDDPHSSSPEDTVVPPARSSSIDAPPPPIHVLRSIATPKHSQRHALTPPSTPSIFATQARDLRRLMASATTADECRLLVDMFLAQSGFPMKGTEFTPDPLLEPSEQQQSAVVEALLSNGDALSEKKSVEKGARQPNGDMQHEASLGLPSPLSSAHSPMTTVFRKPVPSSGVHATPVAHAVVSAEA